jgi:hypothetical protein
MMAHEAHMHPWMVLQDAGDDVSFRTALSNLGTKGLASPVCSWIFAIHTMALHDHIDDAQDEPDNYRESSDEDFNPTAAAVDESSSSSDEDAAVAAKPAQRKGKRKAPDPEDLDSGDEVTIEAARKRKAKRRKGGKAKDDDLLLSDDEGGEGGLIKTRAQRAGE